MILDGKPLLRGFYSGLVQSGLVGLVGRSEQRFTAKVFISVIARRATKMMGGSEWLMMFFGPKSLHNNRAMVRPQSRHASHADDPRYI